LPVLFHVVVVRLSNEFPSTEVVVFFCWTTPLSQLVEVVVWLGAATATAGAGTTTGAGDATITRDGSRTTGGWGAICTIGAGIVSTSLVVEMHP
jgi:hypothetical protein